MQELERLITRMKTTLSSTEINLRKLDDEITKEEEEIVKLEAANEKLKIET